MSQQTSSNSWKNCSYFLFGKYLNEQTMRPNKYFCTSFLKGGTLFKTYMMRCVNLFQPNVAFHIETSHLMYCADQMIGFYMKSNTGLK